MSRMKLFTALMAALIALGSCGKKDGPVKVELKYQNGKYQLYRGGNPFYIYGAGCEFGDIANLASHGANSFRTWRTENGKESAQVILDRAQANGLTVMMGLEIGRERHGFDYNDTAMVNKQFNYIKGEVMKYKDHPALLGWGVGNELNLDYSNKKVWDAVNDIAKMIHEVDGNHIATTMLAGIGKGEVDYIKENCPDIDFLSIQMYGDIVNLQKRIDDAGWDGAYIVTEWGATGHWEVARTSWDVPIEQTSSEKADAIQYRWDNSIFSNKTNCLGSYVFLWGQKQERTPTWYGFFLESGEETEAVDVMHRIWTGDWPENRVPRLDSVFLDNKTRFQNIMLEANTEYLIDLYCHDFDNDTLKVTYEILPDVAEYWRGGGDFEERPGTIMKETNLNYNPEIKITSPSESGPYRVFIYIFDGHNNAATANIPFYIN